MKIEMIFKVIKRKAIEKREADINAGLFFLKKCCNSAGKQPSSKC